MSLNYKIKEFTLEQLTMDNSQIKIPQFQRGLVWSKKNQRSFITTMLDGDPFGAILLSQNEEGNYDLIDGLQRVSTIKRFFKNPKEYLDTDFIDDLLFDSIVDIFRKANKIPNAGKTQFIDNLKKNILDFYNQSKSETSMAKNLKKHYEFPDTFSDDIYSNVANIYQSIQDKIKLNSALIPAIIYTGDKSRLPDVFERMNKGAVILSKYEVLASTWYKYEMRITDEEISKYVKNKYLSLRDQSFMEVNFDIEELDNTINVFEYCYALGEILKDKKNGYQCVFGEKKNELSTDSIGFDILAILLGNKVNEVDGIKDFLYNANTNFLTELKDAIKDVANFLVKIVYPWISYGNNDKNDYYSVISGYQALHLFTACFNTLYTLDSSNYELRKIEDSKARHLIKKYLPLNLFYDVISDYWSLNRQVSDLYNNIVDKELLLKYKNNISLDQISDSLHSYINKANDNRRKTIATESKFILNFIHKINIEKNQEYRDLMKDRKFDFEHITPKERVSDIIDDIPVSSISNLCIMLSRDNRAKKQLTLYEDEKTRSAYKLSESILDLMIYPKKSEINFLDLSKDQKKSEFFSFIKNRRNTLEREIKRIIEDYFN